MDGDRRAPADASVTAVLGDDDLLHAALVSNRWLLHASDPAFLHRFRDRHPPRLLGFYAGYFNRHQFVPLPQHPEHAAVSRRLASCNDAFASDKGHYVRHCRNGRLIASFFLEKRLRYRLLSPLLAGEPAAVLPPIPVSPRASKAFTEIFLPEDGGTDGITLVMIWTAGGTVSAELYVLESGGWGVPATAATKLELPSSHGKVATFLKEMMQPVHGKVFVTTLGYTLGLDLATASFFTLELPVGVGHNYKLSCAEGSGLYLVNTEEFKLSVWLHRMTGDDDDGAGGWLLVDTFCVREACERLAGDKWVSQVGDLVALVAVGDNAEFVFLDDAANGLLLYVHMRSRLVEKVYQRSHLACLALGHLHCTPFMMSWPPIFPALNGGHDQQG
ncbi:unnamed protein product [Alopecurus aequalis]